MTQLSSTESKPLEFRPETGESKQTINIPTHKIGWLHSVADQPGAKFDIKVTDALGRLKFEKKDCKSETEQFGELVNLPVLLGEELSVEILNLQGAKTLKVFLN